MSKHSKNPSLKKSYVVIAAGGTGGHLFPAQAVGKQLKEKGNEVFFMGKGLHTSPYFDASFFSYLSIDAATVLKKGLIKKIGAFFSLTKGVVQSYKKLRKEKPAVVIGFGSFHSFPVLVAAYLCKVPLVLFESNSIPGRVNRFFSRYALFSGIQFEEAKKFLKSPSHEVKMPSFRKEILPSKQEALSYFSLEKDRYTFLVFGGSQGAVSLNRHVALMLQELSLEKKDMQVIHMTGHQQETEEIKDLYKKANICFCVKPFEKNMVHAWTIADVAICRSGAATLAEMLEFEVPAILIPYPAASDGHQLKNALFFEHEVQAAFHLEQKNLSPQSLLVLVKIFDAPKMKQSIQRFKRKKERLEFIDHLTHLL